MIYNAWTLGNGTLVESFYPTVAGYKQTTIANRDTARARGGALYSQNYTTYNRWEFEVSFVNSSTTKWINQWWANNDVLTLRPGYTTDVFTVRLIDDDAPIAKVEKGYVDYFHAKLILEEVS